MESVDRIDRVSGLVLGTALGDAAGLPFEGMSPRRIGRRLGARPLVPSLWAGRALLSDDTEHTALVARALASSGGEPAAFARALARSLRRWLWSLPPGIGWATLRSLARLSLGWPIARSGVRSAGNGPVMRAALLGAGARDDDHRRALVAISTRATHTDPRAEDAALAIARAARAVTPAVGSAALVAELAEAATTEPLQRALAEIASALAAERSPIAALGWQRGVSGYCVDSTAAALWAWGAHRGDPAAAIEAAVRLGGDTDSVAAVAGALAGHEVGAAALPEPWLRALIDWPLSRDHLRALAAAVCGRALPPDRTLGALPRNLLAGVLLVAHAVRRVAW